MKAGSPGEALARIARSREEVLQKVEGLEKALQRDIVQALDLRYSDELGLQSAEFEFGTDIFSGSLDLTPTDPAAERVRFSPPFINHGSVTVEPIDVFFTRWAALVVFRVGQDEESDASLSLDWHVRSDRTDNPIFLLDEDNDEYCYPTASSLTGAVVPGHPRTGIIAFELCERPTTRYSIHFTEIRLGTSEDDRVTFSFSVIDREMDLRAVIEAPSLLDEVSAALDRETERIGSGRTG